MDKAGPSLLRCRNDFGNTPLQYAAICGAEVYIIDMLLTYWRVVTHSAIEGIDNVDAMILETRNIRGRTPLLSAAAHGCADIVDYLLRNGADLDASSPPSGFTAIHLAAYYGHVDVMRRLLHARAGLIYAKTEDKDEARVVHVAAMAGQRAVLEFLIEQGADLELTDGKGRTIEDYVSACKDPFRRDTVARFLSTQ